MSLRVVKQGHLSALQDAGRYGYQYLGINPGGAMDLAAARVANLLVGNDGREAVIELHYPASSFLFNEDALIAFSGADFSATINDQPVPLNTPVVVSKYSVLQFLKYISGRCCYLAVRDSFEIPKWLNSYSTNLRAKAGGYEGRFLKKDDTVLFRKKNHYSSLLNGKDFIVLPWHSDVSFLYSTNTLFRICTGAEYDQLSASGKEALLSSNYVITPQSDRMGYRMKGESLQMESTKEMISTAVSRGTIQLLPDGQLIILMADHQTTGGYPRVGHVISADLPALSQLGPNRSLKFQMISYEAAEDLWLYQRHQLQILQSACIFQLQNYFATHEQY